MMACESSSCYSILDADYPSVSIGSVMPDRFEHYPESEFKNAINLQVVREINYLKGFPSFDGKRKGDFEPPVRPWTRKLAHVSIYRLYADSVHACSTYSAQRYVADTF